MGIKENFKREVLDIEQRVDLTKDEKVTRLVNLAGIACATTAFQPIPFADIFILVPIQAYFASRIAATRGVPLSEQAAAEWVKQIIGLGGMGFLAQQVALGVWKIVTLGTGGLLTLPLVYGLTHAIMRAADAYFLAKSKGRTLSDDELREIYQRSFKEGKKEGAKREVVIRKEAKGGLS